MSKHENWHLPVQKLAAKRDKEPVPYFETFTLDENLKTLGRGKTYTIETFGCQANERDSENLAGLLEAMGYTKEENKTPDIVLFNTCGIRENAANSVFGMIGEYKHVLKSKPDAILAVCGCLAQEENFVNRLIDHYPYVRLAFGTHNIPELPELIAKTQEEGRVVEVYSRQGEVYENLPEHRQSRHKAMVNIMYGCDKFCTYCIVPYTRGKQRSRHADEILKEVRLLKKLGYREITLLGQNVNAYGKDLEGQPDFAALLAMVAQTGMERIRFMTSHPWDFSQAMIETIAKYPNILPVVHLPVQSGDNEVLRRMGRRYTREQYLDLARRLREAIPDVVITTDIIVGFPTEDEQAFENTLALVREIQYDSAFTFIYSPRPGTPAAKLEDHTPLDVKTKRLIELNDLWHESALAKNKAYEGKSVYVLADGPSKKNVNVWSGYDEHGKLVNFTGENLKVGDIIPVHITSAHTFFLSGEAVKEETE